MTAHDISDRVAREVVDRLYLEDPALSARYVLSQGQVIAFSIAATIGFAMAGLFPTISAGVLVGALAAFHTLSFAFKAIVALIGRSYTEDTPAPPSMTLPVYSIIVPLYREAAIIPSLLRAINALDYPQDRLDVIFALEAGDEETRQVLERSDLPRHMRTVHVPQFGPRTKPKALSYALAFARGEFTTVFDAEDQPERDQLKRAVLRFANEPDDVACLQARLNYFNADENWLTRGIMAQTPQANFPSPA